MYSTLPLGRLTLLVRRLPRHENMKLNTLPAGADSLLPEQLKALAEKHTGGRITIVALDATWGNARRMQGWFPKGVGTATPFK